MMSVRRGDVGVPAAGIGVLALSPRGVAAEPLLETAGVYRVDLRCVLGRRVVVRVGVGELPELMAELTLRRVVKPLVPEEHDLPLLKRLLDGADSASGPHSSRLRIGY